MLTVIQNISMSLPRPQHKESNNMHVHNILRYYESNIVVLVQKNRTSRKMPEKMCNTVQHSTWWY